MVKLHFSGEEDEEQLNEIARKISELCDLYHDKYKDAERKYCI